MEQNTTSSVAAISFARKLAMEGRTPDDIFYRVTSAGYRIGKQDVDRVVEDCLTHRAVMRHVLSVP